MRFLPAAAALGLLVLASHAGFVHRLFSVQSGGAIARDYSSRIEVSDPPLAGARLDAIASSIARRPVTVACSAPPEHAAGYVVWDTYTGAHNSTNLTAAVCVDLEHFRRGLSAAEWRCVAADAPGDCAGTVRQTIFAMHVLAHESWHMAGIGNEWSADCAGFRSEPAVAQALGASATQAAELQRYYHDHFAAIGGTPAGYLQAPC